jgi:hypothetical protein
VTWVRFDDLFPIHRKVGPLDDATFRLAVEAVFWCSRSLTDGRIRVDELDSISRRANRTRAAKLVERGLWHDAAYVCESENCPEPGPDGWVIHDYLQYQPSRAKVVADAAAKAERQKKWLAKMAERRNGDTSHDKSKDDAPSPTPSPPRREAGTGVPEKRPAADHAYGAADRSKIRCPTCGNTLESAYHQNTCRNTSAA